MVSAHARGDASRSPERADREPLHETLVARVAASVLLLLLLPPFALAFLASLALALTLLPLILVHGLVWGRGAVAHEARRSPSHRGERRDIPRA